MATATKDLKKVCQSSLCFHETSNVLLLGKHIGLRIQGLQKCDRKRRIYSHTENLCYKWIFFVTIIIYYITTASIQ